MADRPRAGSWAIERAGRADPELLGENIEDRFPRDGSSRAAHRQDVDELRLESSMAERRIDRLSFVFDANAGFAAALIDSARKLIRLNGCDLCTITHGIMGEKSEMASCRETLGVDVDYVHRDEMDPALIDVTRRRLPAVVAHTGDAVWLLLDRDVIARCRGSVSDLRGKLSFHAAKLGLVLPDER
jgi:hypothetical protein